MHSPPMLFPQCQPEHKSLGSGRGMSRRWRLSGWMLDRNTTPRLLFQPGSSAPVLGWRIWSIITEPCALSWHNSPTHGTANSLQQRCTLSFGGYTACVFLSQLTCPSSSLLARSWNLPLRAGSETLCRIYDPDKHALCFLPPRCLLFSKKGSDLFIFMGCFLAKNIREMKGSFNRYQACRFGTLMLPRLNSVVSHDSFLTLSCFAATDRQRIHILCLSGSGQIFWLRLGSWRVTRPVAVLAVCATHIGPPPPWNSSWGLYGL